MEDFTRTMGLEVMFQHARHKGERERERKRKKNTSTNYMLSCMQFLEVE